jgi:uncharacterized SAM-binding protein YcdF (DUF218 family)
MGWPQRLRILLRLIYFALAALGLLVVVVTVSPLDHWWATKLAGPWNDPRGEVLVVLGGSMLDTGTIGGSSYWRSVYAAQAWKEGNFREVVLLGGGPEKGSAAEAMRDFLVCQGVPQQAIRLESMSSSTRENALSAKQMLAGSQGRKVLLTSDYHMFRAHRAFHRVGLEVLPRPYPDVRKRATRWIGRWPAFLDLLAETAKIAYYCLRDWI